VNALRSIPRTAGNSWRSQNRAEKLLRTFLSLTWIYAGWHKASDSGFLTAGEPTFIGNTLAGYSQNSPISSVLERLSEYPTQVGVFIFLSELAIGIATLLYVAPATAALSGFLMSIALWLSGTFNVSPYFLASNTAYAILWLTYLLLMIGNRRMPATNFQRRNVFRTTIVAGLAVVASLAGRSVASSTSLKSAGTPGKKIVRLAKLPVGKSFKFIHSAQGVPSILFRTKNGVFAYSAICTHLGCTVAYKAGSKKLVCPCHAAQFDPFANGAVTSGPAETPLAKVAVKVSGGWVVES
jgi:thiosulfate dehydrogenase (quinone) large subunit